MTTSYKPLSDRQLERHHDLNETSREYVDALEEQCRRANRLAEAVEEYRQRYPGSAREEALKQEMYLALRSYLGAADEVGPTSATERSAK